MSRTFTIPNRRPNEEVIYVLRRHWVRFLQRVLAAVALLLIPLIPLFVFSDALTTPIQEHTPFGVILVMVASVYYLFIGSFLFHSWIDYYLDAWIVTSERIINIEQKGLFSRVVSELQMENIQDVTFETNGVVQTMFKFGDVYVQTAAEHSRFHFDDVPHPNDVASTILNLHERAKAAHPTTTQGQSASSPRA